MLFLDRSTGKREGGREEWTYLGGRADDEAVVLRDDVQQLLLRETDFVVHLMPAFLKDLDAHLRRPGREGGRRQSCVRKMLARRTNCCWLCNINHHRSTGPKRNWSL